MYIVIIMTLKHHRVIRLTCQPSLTTLLDALQANMDRYPMDILSIYRCLSDVGKRHEDYIESLVPSLLKLDKRYLPKEANVEDLMCKCNRNFWPFHPC